ncbi:hypothetical protein N2152v2_000627 [Parachlorella kessleri]
MEADEHTQPTTSSEDTPHNTTLEVSGAGSGELQGADRAPQVPLAPLESSITQRQQGGRSGTLTPEQRSSTGGAEVGGQGNGQRDQQAQRQARRQAQQQAQQQCLENDLIEDAGEPNPSCHQQQEQQLQQRRHEQGGAGQLAVPHPSSRASAGEAPCIAGIDHSKAAPSTGSNTQPSSPAEVDSSDELKQPVQDAECRICLSFDAPDNMVAPCKCTGSVRYAHLSCLLRWSRERVSTQCEICGATYGAEVLPLLEHAVGEARQQQQGMQREMDRIRRSLRQQAAQSAAATAEGGEGQGASDSSSPGQMSAFRRASKWLVLKVLLLVAVMGGLLYALFFLGSENDGGALWAEILLRILVFVIPLYLVYHGIRACLAHRARVVASRPVVHLLYHRPAKAVGGRQAPGAGAGKIAHSRSHRMTATAACWSSHGACVVVQAAFGSSCELCAGKLGRSSDVQDGGQDRAVA